MNVLELFAKLVLDSTEYEKGLDDAKKNADGIGSKIGSGLKKAAKVGAAALATATTAATGFAASAVKAGEDFDSSISQVAATMGKSLSEMEKEVGTANTAFGTFSGNLREYAQFMGSNTAFSATEAADALNYMALAGYDVQTSMDMLPNVLNLAAAGGMDLATASDMITDSQSALGLSMEETTKLVDQMAKASSKSNTSVSQLGEAILTVGGTAKNLKGGTQELSAALGVLANAGIKGSEGGTALRNILLAMTPKSEAAAEAMKQIGFNAYDANGEMRDLSEVFSDMAKSMDGMSTQERQNILASIFNKVDLKSVNAMLAQSSDGINKVSYALESSAVDWNKYSSSPWMQGEGAMKNFAEQVSYNLKDMGLSVEETADFISNEYDMAFEDAVEAVQTVNTALDTSTSTWEDLTGAIGDADGAAQKMADVQLDNLAGDVTLFKSALEGAQIAVSDELTPSLRKFTKFGTDGLSRLTEAFKEDGLTGAMGELGSIISEGLAMITESLPEMVTAGAELLGAILNGIIENAPKMADTALQIVTDLAGYLIEGLDGFAEKGGEIIKGIANWIVKAIPNLISTGFDIILGLVNAIVENLPELITAAVQILVEIAKGIIDNLPKLIEAIPKMVEALVQGIVENLPLLMDAAIELTMAIVRGIIENLDLILAAAVDIIFALIDGIIDALPSLITQVPRIVIEFVAALVKAFPKVVEGGVKLLGALIKGIVNTIGSLLEYGPKVIAEFLTGLTKGFSKLFDAGKSVVDEVKNGLKKKIDDAKKWGKDLIDNFVSGIKEKIGAVKEVVTGVADKIKSFLGFSEPEDGPLSNFHTYAPDMMNLFAKGVRDNERMLQNTIADAFDFGGLIGNIEANPQLAVAGGGGNINVTMNVYGAQGQNVEELAEIVSAKLGDVVKRKAITW